MDVGILIGVVVALGAVVLGNSLEHGTIRDMVGGPAALIVFGGTLGAVLVNFRIEAAVNALGQLRRVLKKQSMKPGELVEEIVTLAGHARREGILGLEKMVETVSDPILARGLLMAIDGAESDSIRATLETIIENEEERGEEAAKLFEAAGGYAPTIGIVGAVLGLIQVMKNLADMGAVGRGIAAAFVATIYGVASANVLFLPIGGRIRMRARAEAKVKEMVLQGVLALQEGTNPKVIRDRLNSFLEQGNGKQPAQAEAAPKEASAPAA